MKQSTSITLFGIPIALAVSFFMIALARAEVYTVIADSNLLIRKVVNRADTASNLVGALSIGNSAEVLACEDYKSDVAILVRISTVRKGI